MSICTTCREYGGYQRGGVWVRCHCPNGAHFDASYEALSERDKLLADGCHALVALYDKQQPPQQPPISSKDKGLESIAEVASGRVA